MLRLSQSPVLKYNRILSRLAGVTQPLPSVTKSWKWYQIIGTFLVLLNSLSLVIGLFYCYHDVARLCFTLMSLSYMAQVLLKMYILESHEEFTQVFDTMEKISLELDDEDFRVLHRKAFNPIKIYGTTKCSMELFGGVAGIFMYTALSFVVDDLKVLPIPGEGWLPYDPHQMPHYPITVVLQYISYLVAINRNSVIDILLLTCVTIPSTQLKRMHVLLANIFDGSVPEEEWDGRLRVWAKRHQEILCCVNDIRKMSSPYLMVTYAIVMLNLFLVGVMYTSKAEWDALHQSTVTPTLLGAGYQLYLLSAAADSVRDSGEDVANQSLTSELIASGRPITKSFAVIVTRINHPIVMTSAGIYPLSSHTFAKLVNTTFSFFLTVVQIQKHNESLLSIAGVTDDSA